MAAGSGDPGQGESSTGEARFVARSTSYIWTVPEGVTSISMIAVGGGGGAGGSGSNYSGGGGGGGGLSYVNNYAVTAGTTYRVLSGLGGVGGTANGGNGGYGVESYIRIDSPLEYILAAQGGLRGTGANSSPAGTGGNGGTGGSYRSISGQAGGNGGNGGAGQYNAGGGAVAVALVDTPVLAALVVLGIVMVGKQALEAVAEAVVVLEPIHNQITLVAV